MGRPCLSGIWGPGPRQQVDFILVTKAGKVQVINNLLAGRPFSPPGGRLQSWPLKASVSPASL